MNIFKALTYGKGRYQEVHITGLVAYLLNPIEEHGLGNIFLKEFLTETCKLDNGDLTKKLFRDFYQIPAFDVDN